ncbi:elongation factor P [Patescibacteria group bacterium]|nr:elongation factor P [Patescibacteria group bacterium]
MASTSDLKKGAVIKHQNDLYVVKGMEFVNPGKGSAFARTKMKSITSGKTVEVTYKSGENIDIVEVSRQKVQYLYKSGAMYSFMNQETYEMFDLSEEDLGDDAKYLKEGIDVDAIIYNGSVVAIELPRKIQYKVIEAPPAVKGDTASGKVMKEVTLENGLKIRAPMFIKENDTLLVNTTNGEYCERVNE